MREYENNNENNQMDENNENRNDNEVNENQDIQNTSESDENSYGKVNNTSPEQNNQETERSYDQTNAPYNPYFRGYSSNNNQQSSYYRRDPQDNSYNRNNYGNGQYQNNPYNRQSTPNDSENRNNPNIGYNPNSYVPRYQSSEQSRGEISYTPEKKKKQKNKSSYATKTIALVCCITVILSALGGFGGAMLSNHISDGNNNVQIGPDGSESNIPGENVVIYRSIEEVPASIDNTTGEPLTFQQVASFVKESVVEIVTEYNTQSMWYQYVTQGAGSGVIISDNGYIVTNTHVITNEDTGAVADNIKVRLTDGSEYTATAVGYDADEDIAVIKIEAEGLVAAICGNSDNLSVGEELVVVGNPLGELGGTVTNGIVSATEREIQVSGVKMSLIQTNAAVNPGNSGGGMFNMKGELVGIVNAKSSGTGIEGLGFAIPVNRAVEITGQLLEFGYVRGKTTLGVNFRDVSNQNSFFYYYGIKEGVYVESIVNGYEDKVSLEVGDRIIAVNGDEISSSDDITALVRESAVGDTLTFQLYRKGKLLEVEATCFEQVPSSETDVSFSNEGSENPIYSGGFGGLFDDFFNW
ncbi:MAG: trypsin-like serine protease [Ruminococcaceae bacterium]|nr:trypsin-like serine protease [Oscillospiraceae bacterium]